MKTLDDVVELTGEGLTTTSQQDPGSRAGRISPMVDVVFLVLDLLVALLIGWFSIYVVYRLLHEDR